MASHRTDVRRELESNGYKLVRTNGHFIYKNATGHMVVVPNHNKMNENTYRKIMKRIQKG